MSTETSEQASSAPAEGTVVENDGFIDLDKAEEVAQPDENEEKPEGEADKAKPEGEDEKAKKPSGAQRAKMREQRLLSQLADRERELDEMRRSAPAKTAGETEEKPPREEDFQDWFAYQTAKTAFEAGKAVREEIRRDRESREADERSTKQAQVQRERHEAHAERVEDAREVIKDFDEVLAEMKGVNVRDDVIEEIMSSDKSAVLAYHLAKNPDKLDAMNRMSPRELAREVGRLEATVKLPEAKKQTSAPPPLSAVKGGASPSSPEADLSAWLKKTYG